MLRLLIRSLDNCSEKQAHHPNDFEFPASLCDRGLEELPGCKLLTYKRVSRTHCFCRLDSIVSSVSVNTHTLD